MSWQSYVDNLMAQQFDKVAILGKDGGVWACSEGFQLDNSEVSDICHGLNDGGKKFQECGIRCGGKKFMYLQSDTEQIQGKLGQKEGISVAKGNQCVLVGVHNGDKLAAGSARNKLETMRDYLKNSGY